MPDYKKVATTAERLAEALQVSGKKRSELIKETGLSSANVSRYINGIIEPRQKAMQKMARCLNVSELWLRGYDLPKSSYEELPRDETVVQENFTFSLRLRCALKEAKMTANTLCERTGISPSMISCYLNGIYKPKPEWVAILAKELEVSEAWLLGYTDIKAEVPTQEEVLTLHYVFCPDRLRQALKVSGLKQFELAEKIGIDSRRISAYVLGRVVPQSKVVAKMASALGVSEAWLMGFGETMCFNDSDDFSRATVALRKDPEFLDLIAKLATLPPAEYEIVQRVLNILYDGLMAKYDKTT